MTTKKEPVRIKYRNEHGAKMFQMGINDSLEDDLYIVKNYGGPNKWPELMEGKETAIMGADEFVRCTQNGRGMLYVKCSTDSFHKLKARYK